MDEVERLRTQVAAARALVQDWRERHGILAHVRAADELEAALTPKPPAAPEPSTKG